MKNNLIKLAALLAVFMAPAIQAQDASSMSELLRQIEQGTARDSAETRQRLADFQSRQAEQQQLLANARAERAQLEQRGEQLEEQFEANNERLAVRQAELDERLGELKELFGVLQQVTGDAQSVFGSSLTNIQFPDRQAFLVDLGKRMSSTTSLASIEDIERLWAELQREITESGRVVTFNTDVITDGELQSTPVTRVGVFNIVTDGQYLEYNTETKMITGLPRQPQPRFVNTTSAVTNADPSQVVKFGLDPTRGGVLSTLVESLTLVERIAQGGIVGYAIIGLGIVGLLIALVLLLSLLGANAKVSRQLKSVSDPKPDNALGRVLMAYTENKGVDTETLELKLNEAVLKEVPKINRGLMIVKVIAVVAPLAGLLGTVTGMIKTFQVITLYGAGDPKLMAGGISQALVTTVLGLVVAIPMVLLHTVLAGRAKRLLGILQEQSAGLVAEHSEAAHNA
jgi:biopolymer transport protein ExbB